MKFIYEHQKKLYGKIDLSKGFVTKIELNGAKIRKDEVYRLCKSGDLKRLCSGVYKVKAKKLDIEKLIKAIIPDAVFCLRYSLKQYENNETLEYPEEIRERKRTVYDVAVTWDVSPSKLKQIPGVKINYFRYHKKYKDIGLTTSTNSQLPFYDYERTVCDAFCRYNEVGFTERWYKEVAYKYNKIAKDEDKQRLTLYCELLHLNNEVKAKIHKHILDREKSREPFVQSGNRMQKSPKIRKFDRTTTNHKSTNSHDANVQPDNLNYSNDDLDYLYDSDYSYEEYYSNDSDDSYDIFNPNDIDD